MRTKPLTNKEKADEFLRICSEDNNIKKHMIYKVLQKNKSYLTEDFDDFFTDTLLTCYQTILKNGGEFPFPSNYKGYLYESLKNNYQEHQKKNKKYHQMFVPLFISDDSDFSDALTIDDFQTAEEEMYDRVEDETTEQEDIQMIMMNLYRLDEHLREPLLLHYINKQSYKQIAKTLGITFHMVRNRMYVARQELKQQMVEWNKNEMIELWKKENRK